MEGAKIHGENSIRQKNQVSCLTSKANIFKEKYGAKLKFPEEWEFSRPTFKIEFQFKKPSAEELRIFSGTIFINNDN